MEPEIIMEGQYRIYRLADGGIHIAYRKGDDPADLHVEIPGMMVRLAEMAQHGKISPVQAMRELMRNGRE